MRPALPLSVLTRADWRGYATSSDRAATGGSRAHWKDVVAGETPAKFVQPIDVVGGDHSARGHVPRPRNHAAPDVPGLLDADERGRSVRPASAAQAETDEQNEPAAPHPGKARSDQIGDQFGSCAT